MSPHLFVSDADGHLYDTRVAGWSELPPLRRNYRTHGRTLRTAADVKAALRAGPYAWLRTAADVKAALRAGPTTDWGGYPVYFVAADGEALSFDAVRNNMREVLSAMADCHNRDWRVVAVDINYEDAELTCAHTGERIPSACGED